MQGKYKVESTEAEFLDQSWDKMRLLLDEHMPHAMPPKPSRPKYELFFLLGLFAWTVYLYWPAQNAKEPAVESDEQKEVIAQNERQESYEIKTLESKDVQQVLSSTAAVGNNVIDVGKNIFPNAIARFIPTTHRKTDSSIESVKQVLTDLPSFEIDKLIEDENENVLLTEVANTDIAPLAQLAYRISAPAFTRPQLPLKISEAKKERTLIMGIHAGEVVDRNRYSGFTVGVFAELELNRRFSLFSSLELNGIKKILPTQNDFDAAEDFFELQASSDLDREALDAGMSILYGTAVNNQEFKVLGVDEMNYVNLPLELIFKVNPTMRVNVGMSFSYLMSATMRNDNRPGGWSPAEQAGDNNALSGKYGQELLGEAINRWDFAPSIGFSFRPVRKLTLDLKFRNGIIDISKDDFFGAQEYHSNRYLHLGLGIDLYERKLTSR